jgi:hypothetical protein
MSAPRYVPLIAPAPGQNPVEALLAVVEAHAAEAGWDQPTRLYRVDRVPAGLAVAEFLPAVSVPLGRVHPSLLLGVLAGHFRHGGTAALPPEWCGFVLVIETWSITADLTDTAAVAAARADAAARRVHARPDRVETRLALGALTLAGAEGTYCRARDDDAGWYVPKLMAGTVGESVRRLVDEVAAQRGVGR